MSKTSPGRAKIRERERKAMELRKAGASYAQIGEALGVTRPGAYGIVKRVMERNRKLADDDAEVVVRMELERLDTMLVGLWDRARKGEVKAIDRVLKIMERRSAYLGLDAPKELKVEHDTAETAGDEVVGLVTGLAERIGSNGAAKLTH